MKNYYFQPSDILVFPVIDWQYRFQRPQQICTRLARNGHRVFYFRTYVLHGTKPVYKPILEDLPLFDVQLGLLEHKNIIAEHLDEGSQMLFLDQIDFLREKFKISKAICFVDLPFWSPLVLELKKIYGWKLIFHAMDQLSGFSNINPFTLEPEAELIKKSDLVLTTSHLLYNEKVRLNPDCLLVPNGTDFDHFNYSTEEIPEEIRDIRKPIIGYYGAMSDWLDTELIHELASARPDWNFVLIGRIESADVSRINGLNNVFLFGEKPYELLPGYLQQFDTCVIPFKKTQLTEATNPVKLFEFLSAGKSVVATDLDELRYYQEYVRLVSSLKEWFDAIEAALDDYAPEQVEKRLRFARQNTWDERILSVEDAIHWVYQDETEGSAPFPPILSKEYLISSRLITHHAGNDYWSLVYEKDAVIYKQTSFDLAEREARILSRFESAYFPSFLESRFEGEYSVISFEKTCDQSLQDALTLINSSVLELHTFVCHCLNILVSLEDKGITHRNICRDTIILQDGRPLLLDFGWAISEDEPYFSPPGLGGDERSPGVHFSDVYSMGKIFEYVNRQHYRAFDWVISLMTIKEPSMRITDLIVLKTLFDTALKFTLEDQERSGE